VTLLTKKGFYFKYQINSIRSALLIDFQTLSKKKQFKEREKQTEREREIEREKKGML
jgi:hypothetical protein